MFLFVGHMEAPDEIVLVNVVANLNIHLESFRLPDKSESNIQSHFSSVWTWTDSWGQNLFDQQVTNFVRLLFCVGQVVHSGFDYVSGSQFYLHLMHAQKDNHGHAWVCSDATHIPTNSFALSYLHSRQLVAVKCLKCSGASAKDKHPRFRKTNVFNMFSRPQGYTQCISVNVHTECKLNSVCKKRKLEIQMNAFIACQASLLHDSFFYLKICYFLSYFISVYLVHAPNSVDSAFCLGYLWFVVLCILLEDRINSIKGILNSNRVKLTEEIFSAV